MLGSGPRADGSVNSKTAELFIACIRGDTAKLIGLIDKGADINAIDSKTGLTLLITAILANRTDIINALMDRGVNLSATAAIGTGRLSYAGITPLMMSCRVGNIDTTTRLIEEGCRHDTLDGEENTAMHHACVSGNLEIVRYLVEKFGMQDFNKTNKRGSSITAIAVKHNKEVAKYLLTEIQKQSQSEDLGGSKSAEDPVARATKSTPPADLGTALEDEEYDELIPRKLIDIIESGKDVVDGEIIASIAGVAESKIDGILIELSASENVKNAHLIDKISSVIVSQLQHVDRRLTNLLHATITYNRFLTAQAIIAKIAGEPELLFSPDEVDGTKECVLHMILQNEESHWHEMLEDLVTKYPKFIESIDYYGRTPLHAACEYGSVEGVETLIANGANVNAIANEGETPIMLALKSKELNKDKLLAIVEKMSGICDLSIRDKYKSSAAHYAAVQEYTKFKEIFLRAKNIRKTLTEGLYPGISSYLESDSSLARKLVICQGSDIEKEVAEYKKTKDEQKAGKKRAKRQAQRAMTKSRKGRPVTAPSTLPEAATAPEKAPAKIPTELLEEMRSRHASLTESLRRKRSAVKLIAKEIAGLSQEKKVELIKAALAEPNDKYLLSIIYKQSPVLQALMEGDCATLEQAIHEGVSGAGKITRLALGSRVYQPLMLQEVTASTDIDMKLQIADVSIFKGNDAVTNLGSRMSKAISRMTGMPYQLSPESVNVFTTHHGETININLSFQHPGTPDIDITIHDHRYHSQSPTTINECAIVKTSNQESKVNAGIEILRPAINYQYILCSDADYASEKKLTSFVRAMITLGKAGKDPVKTIKQNKENLEEFVLSSLDPSNILLRLELLSANLVRAEEKARAIKPDDPELVAKITQQAEKISAFYHDAITELKAKVEETWKSRYQREVQKSMTLEAAVEKQGAIIATRDAQIIELQRQLTAAQSMMTTPGKAFYSGGTSYHNPATTPPIDMTPERRIYTAEAERPIYRGRLQPTAIIPPSLTPGYPNPSSRDSSPTRGALSDPKASTMQHVSHITPKI